MIGARTSRSDSKVKKLLGDDNPRSGVVDTIFTAEEFEQVLKIAIFATQKADDLNPSWWVVCSATEMYATDIRPEETKDLDALYVLELPSASTRGKGLEALLKYLRRWALQGDK